MVFELPRCLLFGSRVLSAGHETLSSNVSLCSSLSATSTLGRARFISEIPTTRRQSQRQSRRPARTLKDIPGIFPPPWNSCIWIFIIALERSMCSMVPRRSNRSFSISPATRGVASAVEVDVSRNRYVKVPAKVKSRALCENGYGVAYPQWLTEVCTFTNERSIYWT